LRFETAMLTKINARRSSSNKNASSQSVSIPQKSGLGPANPSAIASTFHQVLADPDIVERVHVTIKDAHVFKLPTRKSATIGYRGADWKDKIWQGSLKVVERGDHCAILLVDKSNGNLFAVCPVMEGAVERCVDSSRYFVLKIESAQGRHMFIGVAFNERNDAFDFNTGLQDVERAKEAELAPTAPANYPSKDYSLKEGQKIRVNIPKNKGSNFKAGQTDKPTSKYNIITKHME